MKNLINGAELMFLKGKQLLAEKKEAVDQIVILFIIIAVACGIIGLFYTYASGTLLQTVQTKLNTLIGTWFG